MQNVIMITNSLTHSLIVVMACGQVGDMLICLTHSLHPVLFAQVDWIGATYVVVVLFTILVKDECISLLFCCGISNAESRVSVSEHRMNSKWSEEEQDEM